MTRKPRTTLARKKWSIRKSCCPQMLHPNMLTERLSGTPLKKSKSNGTPSLQGGLLPLCPEKSRWSYYRRWSKNTARSILFLRECVVISQSMTPTHRDTIRTVISWIITENTHEAIVTKDEYYQAQKAIRNVAPIQYKTEDDFALKGKICCGNCLRQLRHEKQYGEMVFCCGHKRSVGKFSHCYSGYYREQAVNSRVARAIKTVFTALEVVNQGMQEKKSITLQCVDALPQYLI